MENKKSSVPKLRFPGFTGAWEQRKLGEVVEWSKGSGLSKDALNVQGKGIPVIHYADLYKFNSVQKEVIHWTMDDMGTNIPENNLLFPMSDVTPDGLARTSTVLQSNVKAGGDVLIAKLDKEILSIFISYQINRNKNQILPLVTGTTVRHISSKSLNSLKVSIPGKNEQKRIGSILICFDNLIALHQRKLEHLKEQKKGLLQKMFPKNGEVVPEVRFPGFTDDWEQRKLGEEFKKVNERNNGEFGKDRWISVAKMYFQDPDKVTSNNIDTRTYVMRLGDIAFEGHPNNEFKFGRFVANDIGDGVVSELFPIYRHIRDYDNNYWKYAIHLERIMGPIFAKSITSSGNSSNKLAPKDLLRQSIFLPHLDEQKQIGYFFKQFDSLIALHQRKLEHLELMKKGLLQQMFV